MGAVRAETIPGYRLGPQLGHGRTGAVYLATDEKRQVEAAVRVLAPDLARDEAFAGRAVRDSRAAAALGHPHILPVAAAGQANGTVWIAMHYARGESARSLLSRSGPLPPEPAGRLVTHIAAALDAAHGHGLVHGNVRPANILLDEADTAAGEILPGHAYLADFGLYQQVSPDQLLAAGQFPGMLGYAAPEQVEGGALDPRADVYALACTAFELLAGTPPFGREQGPTLMYAQLYAPPPALAASRPGLPAAVDGVLARALAKSPADRYLSCGEFARELRTALGLRPDLVPNELFPDAPVPALAHAGPSAPGGPSEPRRNRRLLVVAGVAVLVAAAGTAAGVALSGRSGPNRTAAQAAGTVPPAARSTARSASPSATPSASAAGQASTQAAALSQLLAATAATHTALHDAVNQIGSCADLSAAVSRLEGVVTQRSAEYTQASALPVTALPDGAALKSGLVGVLGSSLSADRDYLTWGRQELADGCAAPQDSGAYQAAYAASLRANAAKTSFVAAWDRVATEYGLTKVSAASI